MKSKLLMAKSFTTALPKFRLGVSLCCLSSLFAFKSAVSQSAYVTVQSGAFNSSSTWRGKKVPPAGAEVTILHDVLVAGNTKALSGITVKSGSLKLGKGADLSTNDVDIEGGDLIVGTGELTLGKSGGDNKTLTMRQGSLQITGGKFSVNGNINMTGGKFVMTGGSLVIDPNSGLPVNSVARNVDVFAMSSSVQQNVQDGTIYFVDPPFAGTGRTLFFYGNGSNASWVGSTVIFGGASGDDLSTSVNGFNVDTRGSGQSGKYLLLGDVVVDASKAKLALGNRFLSGSTNSSNGFYVGGDLTIKEKSEVRTLPGGADLTIAGNLSNGGSFVDMSGIEFALPNGSNNKVQRVTINGKGLFKNSTTRPMANFTNLTFDNTARPIAVVFNFGDGVKKDGSIFVSGKVNFTNGIVDIGTDNHLIFTLTATSSRVNGALLRGFGPGGGAQMVKQFPAGASSFTYHIADNVGSYDYSPVTVSFKSNSYNGKVVSISVFDAVHSRLKTGGTPEDYLSRYWRVVATPIGTHQVNMRFQYLDEDVVGRSSDLKFAKWDGSRWTNKSSTVSKNLLSIDLNEKTMGGGVLAEVTGRTMKSGAGREFDEMQMDNSSTKATLYPNPVATSNVNIQAEFDKDGGNNHVEVYNTGGQLVMSKSVVTQKGTNKIALALPQNLTPGIYTVLMKDEQSILFQKQMEVIR